MMPVQYRSTHVSRRYNKSTVLYVVTTDAKDAFFISGYATMGLHAFTCSSTIHVQMQSVDVILWAKCCHALSSRTTSLLPECLRKAYSRNQSLNRIQNNSSIPAIIRFSPFTSSTQHLSCNLNDPPL